MCTVKETFKLMGKWNHATKPLLCPGFKELPIISYNKGRSLKGMRATAKILKVNTKFHAGIDVQPVTSRSFSLKIIYVSTRLEWAFSSVFS